MSAALRFESGVRLRRWSSVAALVIGLGALRPAAQSRDPVSIMNDVGERYVKLVLALGEHDAAYVDAYYGPAEWKTEAGRRKLSLADIDRDAKALLDQLGRAGIVADDVLVPMRHEYLLHQLQAMRARIRMLAGATLTFDEESRALYDAVAPQHPESYFDTALQALEKALPGDGPLVDRYDRFRQDFVIPPDKLAYVFDRAIAECRARTLKHVTLPADERFTVEYVTNKSWSGYNWYQGGYRSLIQVNTDLPIYVDRAVDLACHEGYPGHHVYNVLLEQRLTQERGWVEFSVYALFSPQSLIAEGTANYGIDVTFPGDERQVFEGRELFPAAGLDPARVDEYYRVQALVERLSYAGNEAARRYLNRSIDRTQAATWLTRYALMSPPRAEQRVRFMDDYRSYVINYNLGKDMVRHFVERQAGASATERWRVFIALLGSPRLPSGLG